MSNKKEVKLVSGLDLFKLIDSAVKGGAKSQEAVTNLVKAIKGEAADGSDVSAMIQADNEAVAALIDAAKRIEAAYPVKKEEGKDVNREGRNARLSVLRVQLGRACKALNIHKLTLKAVQGEMQLTQASPNNSPDGDEGVDDPPEGSSAATDKAMDDAVFKAAQLTVANLSNPLILSMVRDALANMKANIRN